MLFANTVLYIRCGQYKNAIRQILIHDVRQFQWFAKSFTHEINQLSGNTVCIHSKYTAHKYYTHVCTQVHCRSTPRTPYTRVAQPQIADSQHYICRQLESPGSYWGCWFDHSPVHLGDHSPQLQRSKVKGNSIHTYCDMCGNEFNWNIYLVHFINWKALLLVSQKLSQGLNPLATIHKKQAKEAEIMY